MNDKPIVNINDVPARENKKGSRFAFTALRAGGAVGAKALGATYMIVPPGRTAFPRHCHHNNEEMFIILEGTGTYRKGDDSWDVKPGDVVSALPGGVETAHILVNTGSTELKYWSLSTRNDPDICEYPDSGKYMVASGIPQNGGMANAQFVLRGRDTTPLDYYDGEDIGEEQK